MKRKLFKTYKIMNKKRDNFVFFFVLKVVMTIKSGRFTITIYTL